LNEGQEKTKKKKNRKCGRIVADSRGRKSLLRNSCEEVDFRQEMSSSEKNKKKEMKLKGIKLEKRKSGQ
jgi:hypothetical protein